MDGRSARYFYSPEELEAYRRGRKHNSNSSKKVGFSAPLGKRYSKEIGATIDDNYDPIKARTDKISIDVTQAMIDKEYSKISNKAVDKKQFDSFIESMDKMATDIRDLKSRRDELFSEADSLRSIIEDRSISIEERQVAEKRFKEIRSMFYDVDSKLVRTLDMVKNDAALYAAYLKRYHENK